MRLRHVENAHEIIKDNEKAIFRPERFKGKWDEIFGNKNPLHVEFGSGRGSFIMGMAEKYPNINYLAFERNSKVVIRALKKLPEECPENFYFAHSDIKLIDEIFNDNDLDRIYLNFSDPWPKKRHSKRRLTYRGFLKDYERILKSSGDLHFKTDNDGLFNFSIEELKEQGCNITLVTRDLHNSQYSEDNVMTEYEKKFSKQGKKINKLIAIPPVE